MYRFPSLFRPPRHIRDRRVQLEVEKRSMLSVISGSQVEDFSVSQPPLACRPSTEQESELPGQLVSSVPNDLLKPSTSEDADRSPVSSAPSSPNRMKSNQRWLKLRTTVQLSGALASASKQKPTLKREDSFITRFSTRQIVEAQDTLEVPLADSEKVSGGSDVPPRKRGKKPPWSVINPDESFYFCWLFVLTLCVLYNVWTLIVRQAFPELQETLHRWWIAGDVLSDLVYVSDIVVQLRTGYLEQGLMVYDSRKLARHYVFSRPFVLDLLSIVPVDLLQLVVGVCPMLRFPRFVKVYRTRSYYYMVESRTLFPNVWRVAMLVHVLLLLAHWFGCFYFLLSEAEGFRGDWTYPYHLSEEFSTLTRKYLASVYWSTLTLTTIGDLPTPNTNNQYLFTIVSYLIGVFIFATIVGQVGNVITNRNANRLEFERLLDSAKLYMRHHRVPRNMQRRVQRWYDYSWSRGHIQGGGDINAALGLLPDKLRTELALHVNLMTLKKVTIFKACQPEFLHDLVLKMRAYIFTPGDLICRKGEVAREMFIIADGILEVISESGKVLTTMKAGDFFGEIGILNLDGLNKRTADVRSVGYSELFSLSRDNVLGAMRDYPEAQEILQTLGRHRLLEARKASCGRSAPSSDISGATGNTAAAETERKSTGRRRPETIKHVLRRVKRVDSDGETEMAVFSSDEKPDDACEADTVHKRRRSSQRRRKVGAAVTQSRLSPSGADSVSGSPPTEVIGAGLPLLRRLQLLREREARAASGDNHVDRAERSENCEKTGTTSPEPRAQGRRESSARGLPPVLKLLQGRTSCAESTVGDTRSIASTAHTLCYTTAARPAMLPTSSATNSPKSPRVAPTLLAISTATQTNGSPQTSDEGGNSESIATDGGGGGGGGGGGNVSSESGAPIRDSTEPAAELAPTAVVSAATTSTISAVQSLPGLPAAPNDTPVQLLSSQYHRAAEDTVFRYDGDSISDVMGGSPAGSDTAQRRGLKSILRRLGGSMDADSPIDSPTVHGYLARKKSLMKSVSFNQHTPPTSVRGSRDSLPDVTSQRSQSQARAHNSSGDLLAEIRSLLHEKLTEIHESLNARMASLENEMKERDRILRDICTRRQCQELLTISSDSASSQEGSNDQISFNSGEPAASEVPRPELWRPRQRSWPYEPDQRTGASQAPARQSWHCRTSIMDEIQPEELWKLEFLSRNRGDAVVEVEASDTEAQTGDTSAPGGSEPDDWEVQMLVEEMARSEQRTQRRLVPELSLSELELLDRLEGGQPSRTTVGRMASLDAAQAAGHAGRARLGRIASLRESSRHRAVHRRETVATVSDNAASSLNSIRSLHRPLLRRNANGDSSRDSSPVSKLHTSGSNTRHEVETVAL